MPSPEYAKFLAMLGPPKPDAFPPLEDRRKMVDQWGEMLPPAADVRFDKDAIAGVPVLWTRTPQSRDDRLIVYLHGGGFTMGSAHNYRDMVSRFARAAEATAVSIEYRLAPEHPFPAGLDDVVAVYRELIRTGRPPSRIVFAGDSAGAALAVSALLRLRDEGAPLPACAVCVSPFADLTLSGASMEKNAAHDPIVQRKSAGGSVARYAQGVAPDHPLVSPIFASFERVPPLLILAGTKESLLDDSVRLAERARSHGVDVEFETAQDMIHIWPYFAAWFPEGQAALERMGAYVGKRLA
ncbi:alpha/beta hydrolase [Ramlibacter sp.]|uniref:alpha/beta hydrolase n=1 Tax=Ramlibacter sp. TaxID=1917967 RepID=UPI003D0C2C89